MHRRSFLQSATLAGGTAFLGATGTSAAPPARPIKKALKYGMIGAGSTIEEKFRIAKEAGFDGVEFNVPTEMDKAELLAARDKTGLEIPGLVCPKPGRNMAHPDAAVREQAIKDFAQALEDCRDYGGTTVLLYPGWVDKENRYADAYNRLLDCVRKLLPAAEKTGIKIALENVWNNLFLSPREAVEFLDTIGHPQVGWYFDVGNVVRFGWPEHWIRHLGGDRLFKLDVKEYSRKIQKEEGLYKGFGVKLLEGDCDWPGVMTALDEVGYTGGWGSAEVRGGDRERLRDIAERMERIFAL